MVDWRRSAASMFVVLLVAAGCATGSEQSTDTTTSAAANPASSTVETSQTSPTTPTGSSEPPQSSSSSIAYTVPVLDDLAVGDDLTERLGLQPLQFYGGLRGDDLAEVEKVRLFLLENPTVKLDIRVHVGAWEFTSDENTLLVSEQSAREIFLHLNNHGIAEDRIVVTGRGRSEPRMFPADPTGRQTPAEYDANNRVEFFVTAL